MSKHLFTISNVTQMLIKSFVISYWLYILKLRVQIVKSVTNDFFTGYIFSVTAETAGEKENK